MGMPTNHNINLRNSLQQVNVFPLKLPILTFHHPAMTQRNHNVNGLLTPQQIGSLLSSLDRVRKHRSTRICSKLERIVANQTHDSEAQPTPLNYQIRADHLFLDQLLENRQARFVGAHVSVRNNDWRNHSRRRSFSNSTP